MILQYQHGIAEAIKAVAKPYGFLIGMTGEFHPGECRD
jgi:hypothetical protein